MKNPVVISCDLCGWPMALPEHCERTGEILGLLVCTQCTEDALEAAVNTGAKVEMVGASR